MGRRGEYAGTWPGNERKRRIVAVSASVVGVDHAVAIGVRRRGAVTRGGRWAEANRLGGVGRVVVAIGAVRVRIAGGTDINRQRTDVRDGMPGGYVAAVL